ncbi:Peptidase family M1 [Thermosyntropha lipolytica DSM 11003]|uniref:Peptidase family M1 n=1 Tax=Thermosyntropha lipolytica DSM 11003 TaxID=1123382 RepID=A0A1M5PZQ9_9FIRM|nr:M1 family metallopeptidase [Thermosyntropha lipolytica]SHH07364.1 Peptidase family M1 [Thermosyntropha lipolytica DSM 11003]
MRGKMLWAAAIIAGVICAACFLYWDRNILLGKEEKALAWEQEAENRRLFPHPDSTWYDMELTLDAASGIIYGHTFLTTRNTSGKALKELWFTAYPNAFKDKKRTPAPREAYYAGFDEGWLKVEKIRVNGITSVFVEKDVNILVILLEEMQEGEDIKIEMEWKAKVPKASYRYGYKEGVFMLSYFYPMLNVLSEKGWHKGANYPWGEPFCLPTANYRVKITVPAPYEVVATGKEIGTIMRKGQNKEYHLEGRNIRDFCLAALVGYQKIEGRNRIADIKVWAPKERAFWAKEVLTEASSILLFYSAVFCSYPYDDFKIVFVPMQGFEGMEYSGLIFLQERFLQPGFADNKKAVFILAHEIAHQWWYNLVGNDQMAEPWLDEGLADFSAYKYMTGVRGEKALDRLQGTVNLGKGLKDMASRKDYYQTAYYGGEAFFAGLEEMLGEEMVYNILRSYLAHYKYDIASREDLFYIIEMESGKKLDAYFASWFKE